MINNQENEGTFDLISRQLATSRIGESKQSSDKGGKELCGWTFKRRRKRELPS